MIIREAIIKIKAALLSLPRELFVGLVVVLVGTASFGLGRLSVQEIAKSPVRVLYSEGESQSAAQVASVRANSAFPTASTPSQGGGVVASKSGTKYHYPWCPGAKSIAEKNKITFESSTAAEGAGYTLAANCK